MTLELVDKQRKFIALRDHYGRLVLRRVSKKDLERIADAPV